MKKLTLSLISCVLIICCLLTGCMKNAESVNLAEPIALGEDGLVSADIFEQIKNQNEIAEITGTSGKYEYRWTVSGADISTPETLCMAVTVTKADAGVRVELKTDKDFGFCPTLSVTLPEKWSELTAGVYDELGIRLGDASLTGSDKTTLSFKISSGVTVYLIMPDAPVETPQPTGEGISDGTSTGQDQYKTDPVPAGKPNPVEPGQAAPAQTDKKLHCTFSIECSSILNNIGDLKPEKLDVLPPDGVILSAVSVEFSEGESVFDVLKRVCSTYGIQIESEWTPMYNSAYIEGIGNLYEFDCGEESGWMYRVNGWYPNYGCSRYQLHDGDTVEWRYTCALGEDIGGGYAA